MNEEIKTGTDIKSESTTGGEIELEGQKGVSGASTGNPVGSGSVTAKRVVVTQDFLDDIQRALKRQEEDIGFLKSVADKKSVALYHQRHKERLPSVVNIRAMDVFNKEAGKAEEKVVMGWGPMPTNDVPKIGDKWYEYQTVQLLYQDGTTQTLTLVDFNRRFRHIPCTQTAVITDEKTGMQSLRLVRQDTGEELVMDVMFVN